MDISRFIGSVKDKATEIANVVANHGMEPSEAVYIGDTVHDVRAAKLAGVISIAVATGYDPMERLMAENPDILVRCLSSLSYITK